MTRLRIIADRLELTLEVDDRPSAPPHFDAEAEGEELTESSGVHQALRPLAKATAKVVPIFRKAVG